MLCEFGVVPEFSNAGSSPLNTCLNWGYQFERNTRSEDIDTLRTLLIHFDQIDDMDSSFNGLLSECLPFARADDFIIAKWLWHNAALTFHGMVLIRIRYKIIRALLGTYSYPGFDSHRASVNRLLVELMDEEMIGHYLQGIYSLMPLVFSSGTYTESESVGAAFIDLLTTLGLDVEACIFMEMDRCGGTLFSRTVLFEVLETGNGQSYVLRWDWLREPHHAGYHLVTEFKMLAGTPHYPKDTEEWPFCKRSFEVADSEERLVRNTRNQKRRFERRSAAKAHKEQARTGQKVIRSKMPGTWEWN